MEVAHALVAGAIASRIQDPVLAPVLSLTSHYILDSIPHWDFGTDWRKRGKFATGIIAVTETCFGILLSLLIFWRYSPASILFLSIGAAILPDVLEAPWYIFFAKNGSHSPSVHAGFWKKFTYRIYVLESNFHAKTTPIIGILTQIVAVVFFLVLLLFPAL